MRFPDRLTVTFDIEPKTNELLVPHLILSRSSRTRCATAIMPREEAGRIEISAHVARWGERPREPDSERVGTTARQEPRPTSEGKFLELIVRDNGNGLSPANGTPEREGIGSRCPVAAGAALRRRAGIHAGQRLRRRRGGAHPHPVLHDSALASAAGGRHVGGGSQPGRPAAAHGGVGEAVVLLANEKPTIRNVYSGSLSVRLRALDVCADTTMAAP